MAEQLGDSSSSAGSAEETTDRSTPLAIRASDQERERAITALREHMVSGRLTLEEFSERMERAQLARSEDELVALLSDLPGESTLVASQRRPTRTLIALFGSSAREGRLRVQGRIRCLMAFGNIDLDLRQASLEGDSIRVAAVGLLGAIDIYVPEGVEVDLHGWALLGHKRTHGNDPPGRAGTPLVRVFALSLLAGIDVWRVPQAWSRKPWREVIHSIRSGGQRELEA